MLSVGRYNLLCALGPSVAKTFLSITALSALVPARVFCAPSSSDTNNGGDDGDIFKLMAHKAKAAMDTFSSDSEALKVDPKGLFEAASKKAHNMVSEGAMGQVGFGFMMGFSSGFFLKKMSKGFAVIAGGLFCLVQALSYQGYMKVNYDRLKSDVENILDLNNDGKVDGDDAETGFNQLSKVLGYNLPSGSGFSVGLVVGLKS